jgi:hypothetical protein
LSVLPWGRLTGPGKCGRRDEQHRRRDEHRRPRGDRRRDEHRRNDEHGRYAAYVSAERPELYL